MMRKKISAKKLKQEPTAFSQAETTHLKSEFSNFERWRDNLSNFSENFMSERVQPPLDKLENLFE
ncbi:hypothetical protein [Dyadobacter sp. 3J3]|uniref:hypothetical protein n=1 Tax=Dyadobacter sp. 3J3 TaxID=2606600 RepID=UPI001357FE1C|nr:hypothetical protein [Dyadobacter sp. 3J3]